MVLIGISEKQMFVAGQKKKPSFFEVASLVTDMRVSLDAKKQTAYERYKKRKKHGSGFPSWTLEFLCQQKLA